MIKWPWVSRKWHENDKLEAAKFATHFVERVQAENDSLTDRLHACAVVIERQDARLARIAALETPKAAHGVKKAAAIARGDL